MGVTPIEMSQMYTRTQDISAVKQNEENKPLLDQQSFQNQFQKQVESQSRKVIDPNRSKNGEYDYDAKKKGNNQYENDGRKPKKREKTSKKLERLSENKGFDIRI